MNTIQITIDALKFGDFVTFSYKNKTRYIMVVTPSEKGKMLGFVIDTNIQSTLSDHFLEFDSKDDYDTAIGIFGNSNFRSYFLEEINNLQLVVPITTKDVNFTFPDLNFEWGEAERYPELATAGKAAWMIAGVTGTVAKLSTLVSSLTKLTNFDIDFNSLNAYRIDRFLIALRKREIEMPILLRFKDAPLEVLAGNTRISGCVYYKIDPTVLVVDVPNISEEKNDV
jgi:hypothetical protein